MTREEKRAIQTQRYRTYSIEPISFDYAEPIENQENREERKVQGNALLLLVSLSFLRINIVIFF